MRFDAAVVARLYRHSTVTALHCLVHGEVVRAGDRRAYLKHLTGEKALHVLRLYRSPALDYSHDITH